MPFRPVNDDHAVQSAVFGISLNKPLAWSSVEALVKSPLDWRRELPAIELSQAVEVQLNAQTGLPQNRMIRGIEFSHKRPDGSFTWQLQIMGTEVRVTTTLYTRWEPTWNKAGDILLGVVGQLAMLEDAKAVEVAAISLLVLDVFASSDETMDFRELFSDGDYLPRSIKRHGKLWHAHSGWYDPGSTGQTLNQLNVDTRTGADDTSLVSISDTDLRVLVQHNQIFRPSPAMPFNLLGQKLLSETIQSAVPKMHRSNKSLLRSILSSAMIERIKLSN